MPTATVERKPGIPPLQRACLFLGMAFYWSCSSISRNDYVIFRRTSSSSDVYATLFVFLIAMLTLGIAFYALRRPLENALVHRRWFVGALSPLASLALVPMLYTDPGSTDAYWPLRAASCFVLVGWYLVVTFAWCLSAVALGVREGVLTAVLTYVASCALSALYLLPSPWHDVFEVAAPTLSGLLWLKSPVRQEDSVAFSPGALKNFPLIAIVLCAVFYCVAGSVRDYVGYENFESAEGFRALVPLAVQAGSAAVLFVAFRLGFRSDANWQSFLTALVVAIIFFFGCLFVVVLGWVPAAKGGELLMSASYMCFKLLLLIFIVVVAESLQASVVTAFSVFFVSVATLFMFVVGTVLPFAVSLAGLDVYANRQTTLLVVAFGLITVTLVCLLRYVLANERSVVASSQKTASHEALQRIAQAHRLTPREVDVAALVLQGYSLKMVAQILYIAEGTVQTHMKNLYRKLGLHSKQELIALVNEGERAQADVGARTASKHTSRTGTSVLP